MRNLAWSLLILAAASAAVAEEAPLRLLQSIPLPAVSGRIDHLALDAAGHRLFVAALGNNTVEVIDLRRGERVHSVPGMHEPQGILYLPESDRLLVANGADGQCTLLDAKTFNVITQVNFKDDADNLRRDAAAGRIYVGYGAGAIGVLTDDCRRVGDIPLDGHPESFQLDAGRRRIFVNVPTARHVAVIDLGEQAVAATWPLEDARRNYPMAFDASAQRLFVACREPAKLVVLDAQSGRKVLDLPLDGDADDIFLDAERRRIYVSCGAGFLDVLQQTDGDQYQLAGRMPTGVGARTSLFDPEMQRLFVAAPRHGGEDARICVFSPATQEPAPGHSSADGGR